MIRFFYVFTVDVGIQATPAGTVTTWYEYRVISINYYWPNCNVDCVLHILWDTPSWSFVRCYRKCLTATQSYKFVLLIIGVAYCRSSAAGHVDEHEEHSVQESWRGSVWGGEIRGGSVVWRGSDGTERRGSTVAAQQVSFVALKYMLITTRRLVD